MTRRKVLPTTRWETFKAIVALVVTMDVAYELKYRHEITLVIGQTRVTLHVGALGFGQSIITPYIFAVTEDGRGCEFWGPHEVPSNPYTLLEKLQ